MGIEIQKASIYAGDIHDFKFSDNIKQYFVGLTGCTLWNSNNEDPQPINRLSVSVEPLSKSGNTLPVKLNATPAYGKLGRSSAIVTVLALTGTDDEDYRMSPSMTNNQTFAIPGNPSILIPSATEFSVSFNDGVGHYLQEFEIQAAAKQQPGNIAMMSSHAKIKDITGHYEHPSSYANGGIFAYAGMSENIRCTTYNLTESTSSVTLENLSDNHGAFISSFTMGFSPGVDKPLWTFGFETQSGHNYRTGKYYVGAYVLLNPHFERPATFYKANVSLIEILD